MKSAPPRQGRNQLRIIGGKWRGRKLEFPPVAGLRPTGDRIRETLFNWLAPTMPGAHCLDLFAGSGALGLEALSRGAERAVLLDTDPQAVRALREHCVKLATDQATVLQSDALQWLTHPDTTGFDIVFVDPPFQAGLLQPVIEALNNSRCLRDDALIYLESGREQAIAVPAGWQLAKEKFAGQVRFALYRRQRPKAEPAPGA